MAEGREVFVTSISESEQLKKFLTSHLPYTLPLLRRLQFHLQGPEAIVVSSFNPADIPSPKHFAVGFIDPQGGGIQSWIFTSLDLPHLFQDSSIAKRDLDDVTSCLYAVFAQIKKTCSRSAEPKDSILVGSIIGVTAGLLQVGLPAGFVMNDKDNPGGPYGKYMLRRSRVQQIADFTLPEDFVYDEVKESDYDIVIANNSLVGTPQNLKERPSVGIRQRSTGLLTGFAYLGQDGCTRTLHVMPDFRNRGFGKKLAAKTVLLTNGAFNSPEDDWAHADIDSSNIASVKLFYGLEAERLWDSYWYRVDLSKISI